MQYVLWKSFSWFGPSPHTAKEIRSNIPYSRSSIHVSRGGLLMHDISAIRRLSPYTFVLHPSLSTGCLPVQYTRHHATYQKNLKMFCFLLDARRCERRDHLNFWPLLAHFWELFWRARTATNQTWWAVKYQDTIVRVGEAREDKMTTTSRFLLVDLTWCFRIYLFAATQIHELVMFLLLFRLIGVFSTAVEDLALPFNRVIALL